MGLVFSGCRRKERSVPCHLKESIVSFWGSLSGPRENPGCCNWGTGKSHFSLQCVSQTFGKCAALRSLCLMDADVTGFVFPCWDTGFVLSEGREQLWCAEAASCHRPVLGAGLLLSPVSSWSHYWGARGLVLLVAGCSSSSEAAGEGGQVLAHAGTAAGAVQPLGAGGLSCQLMASLVSSVALREV